MGRRHETCERFSSGEWPQRAVLATAAGPKARKKRFAPPPFSIRFTDEEHARLNRDAGTLPLAAYFRLMLNCGAENLSNERGPPQTGVGPPTPTTPSRSASRRCASRSRRSGATNTWSRTGSRAIRRTVCADASSRQGLSEAARRRLQPVRRSSPRGRPRRQDHVTASTKTLVPARRSRDHLFSRAKGLREPIEAVAAAVDQPPGPPQIVLQ